MIKILLTSILCLISSLAMFYAFIWFITLEGDFRNWGEDGRSLFLLFSLLWGAVLSAAINVYQANREKSI